jgi:hypothetical protein
MADQNNNLDHLKQSTAVLVACIVETLSKSDPSFKERFVRQMALAYHEPRGNSDQESRPPLDLLSLTRELLISGISGPKHEKTAVIA